MTYEPTTYQPSTNHLPSANIVPIQREGQLVPDGGAARLGDLPCFRKHGRLDGATMGFAPESEDGANAGLGIERDVPQAVMHEFPELSPCVSRALAIKAAAACALRWAAAARCHISFEPELEYGAHAGDCAVRVEDVATVARLAAQGGLGAEARARTVGAEGWGGERPAVVGGAVR